MSFLDRPRCRRLRYALQGKPELVRPTQVITAFPDDNFIFGVPYKLQEEPGGLDDAFMFGAIKPPKRLVMVRRKPVERPATRHVSYDPTHRNWEGWKYLPGASTEGTNVTQ